MLSGRVTEVDVLAEKSRFVLGGVETILQIYLCTALALYYNMILKNFFPGKGTKKAKRAMFCTGEICMFPVHLQKS